MVRAIGDGTLPHPVFRGYFEQNVLYLQEYVRAIALLVAQAPDRAAITPPSGFQDRIVQAENPPTSQLPQPPGGALARPRPCGGRSPPPLTQSCGFTSWRLNNSSVIFASSLSDVGNHQPASSMCCFFSASTSASTVGTCSAR